MADLIRFKFEGKLADENRMDFYEVARFQYAAARLAVKLDHFRRKGTFPDRVTRQANMKIDLKPFAEGSFLIDIIAPIAAISAPLLVELPLSSLWAYVVERIFKPADNEALLSALGTQERLLETFDRTIEGREDTMRRTLDLLQEEIAQNRELSVKNTELNERLLAETGRRSFLEGREEAFSQITGEQDAKLLRMAAPLLKELAIPLRRSAKTAKIFISDDESEPPIPILAADRPMVESVELSVVDPNITTILIDIVKYDKETGWGQFRNPNWEGRAPFSVPSDRKDRLQRKLLGAMHEGENYVAAYFVRSPEGENQRLIVTDVLDLTDIED